MAGPSASSDLTRVLDGEMVEGPLVRSAQAIIHPYETYAARARDRAEERSAAAVP